MNSTNDTPKPGNSAGNIFSKLGNFLLMLIVTPFMLLNEFRRELAKDVYSKFDGGIRAAIGVLLGFAAAGATGHYLGWTLGWRTSAWLSSGVVSWFATYSFAWPLLYLFAVKPAFDLSQLVWDGFREIAKKYADRLFGGIVRTVSGILPGSSGAWNKVLDEKKKDSWVNGLTIGLSYPVSIAGSAYAGLELFRFISTHISSAVLGTTLGVGGGLLVGLSLLGILWQLIEQGRLPFVAVAMGFGLERAFSPELNSISSACHLTGHFGLIGHAIAIVAFIGYVFPLINLALSGGLLKWLADHLKPICERCYDDRDKNYIEFFHNATTLVVTAIAVAKAFAWAGAIALPLWAMIPALAAVALFAYLWIYDVVDHGGGTFITGAASSVLSGWFVGSSYFTHHLPGGIWMAAPLGIITTLAMGAAFFPIAYLILKPVFVRLRISKLGKPLNALHKRVEDNCQKALNKLVRVYESSYRDRTGYQVWFLHAANIAGVFAAVHYLPALLAASAAHLPHFAAHIAPASAGAVLATRIAGGLLTYLLLGRFLQKSNVGTEFVGAISSLVLAVALCSSTVAAGSSWATTAIAGVLSWGAGFFLCFPVAYFIFRFPTKYLLASWSTKLLVKLHDFAWGYFSVVWVRVVAAYMVVDKVIFKPIRKAVAAASHKVSDIYSWLRKKILRHG